MAHRDRIRSALRAANCPEEHLERAAEEAERAGISPDEVSQLVPLVWKLIADLIATFGKKTASAGQAHAREYGAARDPSESQGRQPGEEPQQQQP